MNVTEEAQDLVERFDEEYRDKIDVETVEDFLNDFVEYEVTGDEAIQGTISKVCDHLSSELDSDVSRNQLLGEEDESSQDGDAPFVDLADVNSDGEWVSVEVEVTHLWDNDNEAISQVGVIDDGTDSLKFLAWESSDVPLLSEGETYVLRNVVTKLEEYDGDTTQAVHLNSSTEVEMSDADVTTTEEEQVLTGAILGFQSGSGLIERDEDGNVVSTDYDGETEHDLRIRAVFDTGTDVYTLFLGRELTEVVTGIDLEEAKEIAREALDRSAVHEEMEPMLTGQYWTVTGNVRNDAVFASDIEASEGPELDADELLVRARSL